MFKPMLAATLPTIPGTNPQLLDFTGVKFPLVLSPKLDGIRMMVQSTLTRSRALKPFENPWVQEMFGNAELEALDGELIFGDPTASDCFNQTVRAVCNRTGPKGSMFYVFDSFDDHAGFWDRYQKVRELGPHPFVRVVPQYTAPNEEAVYHFEEECLKAGYEGVIARQPNGRYKQGRSTLNEGLLLKLKRMEDGEAEILDFVEQQTNNNPAFQDALGHTKRSSAQAGKVKSGTLGKLVVRDLVTGVEFRIGTGFDERTGREIWANRPAFRGKIVKYQHQVVGALNKPRIPSFKGMRDPVDMS